MSLKDIIGIIMPKKKPKRNPKVSCVICNKKFISLTGAKVCSNECTRTRNRRSCAEADDRKLEPLHRQETVFSKRIEEYEGSIVDHESSPIGKAYVGLAKKPLMPNDNGIGYKGVLVQSTNRALVQCSECGKWYKIISNRHLNTHGMTREEYKIKFGLNKQQALISDIESIRYAEKMTHISKAAFVKGRDANKMQALNKAREVYRSKIKRKKYNTTQMENNAGTCPLQMKTRLIEYILSHERYPPKNRYSYAVLRDRFGSVNNALRDYGLPTRHRMGMITIYEFNDNTTFNVSNGQGYDQLFALMKAKCPVLNAQTVEV